MLYFAYGHDVNYRSLVEWCDLNDRRAPLPRRQTPAVAINQRLAFPIYSSYWQGGVAGLIAEPGKRVSGAMYELPDNQLDLLNEFFDRRVDAHGKERGDYKLAEVAIEPYGSNQRKNAFTFIPALAEEGHVLPTRLYIDRLIEAALDLELSAMWVMHLRSCITGPEETSRFFPGAVPARAGEMRPVIEPVVEVVSTDPGDVFNPADMTDLPANAPAAITQRSAGQEPRSRTIARLRNRIGV